MANITLHSDSQTSATSVSNIFIDEYMSDANGEFVKIYLYLLRQLNAPDAAFSWQVWQRLPKIVLPSVVPP